MLIPSNRKRITTRRAIALVIIYGAFLGLAALA